MSKFKEKYVVDENGNRVSVLLDIEDFERILDELEELESIKIYDEAKASSGETIPLEQALGEIKEKRRQSTLSCSFHPTSQCDAKPTAIDGRQPEES